MDNRGIFGLPLHSLLHFKVMGSILNGFFLVKLNNISITLRVKVGLIGEELISSFGVEELGKSLSLGVDGNMRKIQVREC